MQPTTQRRTAWVASRWWHAVLAVVIIATLVLQIVLLCTGGADANSGQTGGTTSLGVRFWRLFSYFTIESNLFVLGTSIALAARPTFDGPVWRVVRMDALLGILITGVVYAVVLAPQVQVTGAALVADVGFHYIAPWAAILAWLLFGPRPRMSWGAVGAAFIWPALWLVYIFTQGAFTHWYPYPFLDVTDLGFTAALRNAILVVLVAAVFAAVLKLLDTRLPALVRPAPAPQHEMPV
ncbi:MAG TPA: Pr6Pr family membrane protein [Amycolatopsis sp.]|nr:Pr6Pr family membrane protein [Amycolatopsis sp.]